MRASADVYKGDDLVARLAREPDGPTSFRYFDGYRGAPIASTLPVTGRAVVRPPGAVPTYFAGLLPEGRRLSSIRRRLKVSADDELSLLLAVGGDTVGDVRVVPTGETDLDREEHVAVDSGDLDFAAIRATAEIDRVGVAGVQDKVSGRMLSLPARRAGTRFILKLEPPEYPGVILDEARLLDLSRAVGNRTTVSETLVDVNAEAALLVHRFDRDPATGRRFAVEDACQLLDLYPADKYNPSSEEVGEALVSRCAARPLAARDYYAQVLFAWLTGNGDAHAKNFSVLQQSDGEWRLAPSYDLPSTVPYGDLTFALEVNGADRGLHRDDFRSLANALHLPERAERSVVARLLERTESDHWIDDLPFDEQTRARTRDELDRRRLSMAG